MLIQYPLPTSGQLYCNHAFHSKCLVELCRIQCRQSLECPICRHKQPIRVQGEPILSTHRIPASQIAIAEITWDAEVAPRVVHNGLNGRSLPLLEQTWRVFLVLHLKRCWDDVASCSCSSNFRCFLQTCNSQLNQPWSRCLGMHQSSIVTFVQATLKPWKHLGTSSHHQGSEEML